MKKVIVIVVLFISAASFSQNRVNNFSFDMNRTGQNTIFSSNGINGTIVSKLIDKGTEGSEYIYKSWQPRSVVTMTDGKQYAVPFMNFNAMSNNFAANISSSYNGVHKVTQDSVYVFNNTNISKVNINRSEFVKVSNSSFKNPKFFEVVYGDNNFRLLKLYEGSIRSASFNPMTQQMMGKDKVIIKSKYFLETEDFKEIKLKNKTIVNLFGDKKSDVVSFMKTNKLSVNNENHLMRIFNFYKSLK